VDSAQLLRSARLQAGLTLRELAAAAQTSHSTLAAYETGAKYPTVETLNRIVEAAGFRIEARLTPAAEPFDHAERARELADVLELAEALSASAADR
jgi:transcriptional regulator with XRE-family HTH domain